MKRLLSKERGRLAVVLKLNLVVLAGLLVLWFSLELSGPERWVLTLGTAVLIGFNWAMISHATRGDRK